MHDLNFVISLEPSLFPGRTSHDDVIKFDCDLLGFKCEGVDKF